MIDKELAYTSLLEGSWKQISWASDIKITILRLLEELKNTHTELTDDINLIIDYVGEIHDSSYIIENMREIRSARSKVKKLNNLMDWIEWIEHEKFKDLKIEEFRKIKKI